MDTMRHTPYIEKFEQILESVSIAGIVEVQESLKALLHGDTTNRDAYGNWLIHVLNHCPRLKELEIDAGGILNVNGLLLQEHSTSKKLTFYNIEDASLLAKLTAKMPSVIHVCVVIPQRSRTMLTTLDMPNASLNTLGWEHSAYGYQSHINFSIEIATTSNNETYYFIADKERVIRYTKHNYQQALLQTEMHLKFDIKCKSLKTFHIKYQCGSYIDQSYILNAGTCQT